MSEQSAVLEATTSPEAVVMEVSRGPLVNMTREQRQEFRTTGQMPKVGESATSDVTVAGESEAPKSEQEKPKSEPKPKQTAAERIAELKATIEKIEKGAGLHKPKAESAPAKPEPVQSVSAKPTPDDKNADGTDKFSTHEDFEEALLDWKLDKRQAEKAAQSQQEAANKSLNDKVEEGKTRYENLDEVIQPAANEIYQDKDISPVIKQMIGDSEVIVDLVYTLASDKEGFAKFMKMAKSDPGKAIRYIALTESLIAQELEAKSAPAKEESPAKPRTQAPKPPAEAGGRASTPPDSLQAALEGSGGKLTANLKAEFTRQALARMK